MKIYNKNRVGNLANKADVFVARETSEIDNLTVDEFFRKG